MNYSNPSIELLIFIVHQPILLFGAFANLVNILVFLNLSLKETVFKFLIVISINDFLYCFTESLRDVIYLTKLFNVYTLQFYEIIVIYYFLGCLAILNILCELFISLQRYFLVVNSECLHNVSFVNSILFMGSISFAYYIPRLFMRQVDEHVAKPILDYNNFGKSLTGKILQLTLQITRISLIILCLPAVNILTCVKMKKFIDLI